MNKKDTHIDDLSEDEIEKALSHIDPNLSRDEWTEIGMAIKSELGDSGFDIWNAWSQRADNYRANDARDTWKSIKASGGIGIGTLIFHAKRGGYRSDNSQPQRITPQDAAARRERREADAAREAEETKRRQDQAAADAQAMWADAQPFTGHEYTDRKAIQNPGVVRIGTYRRWHDGGMIEIPGAMLIPARDENGKITTLQSYFPDDDNPLGRDRDYLPGGKKQGSYFNIGKPTGKPDELITIGEGLATVASAQNACGGTGVVAFDAGNLIHIARIMRKKRPDARIVILADNDRFNRKRDGTPYNPGVTASTEAAREIGALIAIPQFLTDDGEPNDFNDLQCREGLDAVRRQISEAYEPPESDPEPTTTAPTSDATPAFVWSKPMNLFAEFPAPPIQRDMLPQAIADYAFECGDLIGVDPSMVAMPAIVACAAALHDDVRIQPKRHETGWQESARLWCAVVGSPSVRKSPAIKRATKRLRKIDRELAEENSKKRAEHAEQMDHYKEAKKEAKKTGGGIQAPEAPAITRMIVEDITVEALSDVLKDNSRGVLCIQDELSGWFGSMDAYSGGKSGNKDRAAWLQAYNGDYRQVDRVMRGSVHIPNFSVSMIGGIQPDAIRRIAKDMTDDGLMQRFMIVIGRNAPEHDRQEHHDIGRQFGELVDSLYGVQPGNGPVLLSEGAHLIRERLMAYSEELADYPALPGGLRSHLGKWSGLFARLLLVYHVIDCIARRQHPNQSKVPQHIAECVDRLMRRFLLPHALAYYTDVLGGSGDLEHARWIAGHILSKKLDSVNNRGLMQAYRQWRGIDDWRRQRIMQMLEDMGWLAAIPEEGRASRRGATTWSVNPEVHTLFAKMAVEESQRRERIRAEIAAMQARN